MKHIRVETNEDLLELVNDEIHARVGKENYVYPVDNVKRVVMLTTDLGPFYDDMGLAVDVGQDTVLFIMSSHRCFSPFLFDQLGKRLPVDYNKIIDASCCTERRIFVIYEKNSRENTSRRPRR